MTKLLLVSNKYSGKENDHLEQAIDANISQFIQLLESKYVSTSTSYNPVDLALKTQYFTLDVISDIAFGKPFGNLKEDKDCTSYIKTNEETLILLIFLGTFPGLAQVFSRILRRFLPKTQTLLAWGD